MSVFSDYFKFIFCHNFISVRFVYKGFGEEVIEDNADLFLLFLRVKKGVIFIGGQCYRAGDIAVVSIYPGVSVSFEDVSFDGFLIPYYKLSDDDKFDVFGRVFCLSKGTDIYDFVMKEAEFCSRNFNGLSRPEQVIYASGVYNKLDLCLVKDQACCQSDEVRLASFLKIIVKNGYRYNLKDFCNDLSLGHSTIYRATVRYGGYRRLKEFACLKSVLYELFQSSRSSYYVNILNKYGFDDIDFFEDRFIRRFGMSPDRIYGSYKWSDTGALIQRREFISRLIYF